MSRTAPIVEPTEAVLARLDERTMVLVENAQRAGERAAADSGRLAKVETLLGSLGTALDRLSASMAALDSTVHGAISRVESIAAAAHRQATSNSDRIDKIDRSLDGAWQEIRRLDSEEQREEARGQGARAVLAAVGVVLTTVATTLGLLRTVGVPLDALAHVVQDEQPSVRGDGEDPAMDATP